jgi:hypothetical protein
MKERQPFHRQREISLMRHEQRHIHMAVGVLQSGGRRSCSLQVSKEEPSHRRFRVIDPHAVRELVSNTRAPINHRLSHLIFRSKASGMKLVPGERIGGIYSAGRRAQAIQCLDNCLVHAHSAPGVTTHRKFDLAKAGEKLTDKLRFIWESIKGGVDAKGHCV